MSASEQDEQIDEEDRKLLSELLGFYQSEPALPEHAPFRTAHVDARGRLDRLERSGLLAHSVGRYRITLLGLRALRSPQAKVAYQRCHEFLGDLRNAYLEALHKPWTPEALGVRFQRSTEEVSRILTLLTGVPGFIDLQIDGKTGFVSYFSLAEPILDAVLLDWPNEDDIEATIAEALLEPRIDRVEISGYRPFAGFSGDLGHLTVIIGANATGKSSLFDALRLLSYAAENPIPPEIDPRHVVGAMLFHAGGTTQIDLAVTVPLAQSQRLRFEVSIQGPLGAPRVVHERLATIDPLGKDAEGPFAFLDFRNGKGMVRNPGEHGRKRTEWTAPPNELALRRTLDPTLVIPSRFRAFVASWRSYPGFDVGPGSAMRQPAYIDQEPVLAEDGANLTAVLNSLVLEHHEAWEELETHLRASVPGFESLNVKPRGARGMAMAFWRERGVKEELALSDLSDGTLRLLCWLSLALSPNLPPVVCIDEPELGLHPRVLPTLAGAFRIASSRAQILISTHSPHFLSQFTLDEIAVMRKEDGHATFVRPGTSDMLRHEVEEIGGDALARLFLSEELEVLP